VVNPTVSSEAARVESGVGPAAAAGCAFYATLSLFPAISMLISVYGLLFDPASVVPQLAVLRDLLRTYDEYEAAEPTNRRRFAFLILAASVARTPDVPVPGIRRRDG